MAELRWGSATHEGQLRAQNEDHHHAGDGIFVVADGMGGHLAIRKPVLKGLHNPGFEAQICQQVQ